MIMKQIKMNVQVDLVKIMGHALTWSTDFNVGVCLGIRELNVKLVICFYSLTELKKTIQNPLIFAKSTSCNLPARLIFPFVSLVEKSLDIDPCNQISTYSEFYNCEIWIHSLYQHSVIIKRKLLFWYYFIVVIVIL